MKKIIITGIVVGLFTPLIAKAAQYGLTSQDAGAMFESVNPENFTYKRTVSATTTDRAMGLVDYAYQKYRKIRDLYEPNQEAWKEINKKYSAAAKALAAWDPNSYYGSVGERREKHPERARAADRLREVLKKTSKEIGYEPDTMDAGWQNSKPACFSGPYEKDRIGVDFPDCFKAQFALRGKEGGPGPDNSVLNEIWFSELFDKQNHDLEILEKNTAERLQQILARLDEINAQITEMGLAVAI